jgi:hypothetical protein
MLVSAFSGYDNVMSAYAHAVANKYRFFSYGDAMFVTKKNSVDFAAAETFRSWNQRNSEQDFSTHH